MPSVSDNLPATEIKLEAVRALLAGTLAVSGPLTLSQLTSAALATAAKQDTGNTTLASILAKLSADPATQTTLAAILAKLTSDPSTGAKQDTGNTTLSSILAKLSADPATQTTLAAILTKLNANLNAIAPAPTSTTISISSGQSLSASYQTDGKFVGFIVPAAWTTAAITFAGSVDGTNFYPIFDAGLERTIASADVVTGRMIILNLSDWLGVKFVRIRSGTSGTPVNQTAQRNFIVISVA